MSRFNVLIAAAVLMVPAAPLLAETPQELRHEMMEDVGGAAKKIGGMMKGEVEFDAETAGKALKVWANAAGYFGDLFPDGSESGFNTEASPEIWNDRAGFDEQLALFSEASLAAVEAAPQDLDALKAAADPVFKVCKSCHEGYRVED